MALSRSTSTKKALAVLGAGAAFLSYASLAWGQSYQTHNLTPDGYWHNRYHMLLGMAAYGDYASTCPNETFTEENKLKNFPDSTRPAWNVVNTFGPTPSGCSGFTAIIPEMNKALIVFRGDYALEQTLPQDTMLWSETTYGNGSATALPAKCDTCKVNKFAMQGYLECKVETNDWQEIREAYYGQDLVFSITGHGLGGAHAQIAGVDLYEQEIDYYNHAHGSPRVFNQPGSDWYGERFNGEAGERGVANNDQYTEFIPEGDDYAHTGTPFYYWGFNHSSLGMNMRICWTEDDPDYSDCMPSPQGSGTPIQDHYFYFTPVTDCGKENRPDHNMVNSFLATVRGNTTSAAITLGSTSSAPSPTSTPPPVQTTQAAAAPASDSSAASPRLLSSSFSFASLVGLGLAVLASF